MSDENPKNGGLLAELPTLGLAVLTALLIRTFLFQSLYVPSESMYPTLLIGDHVFVNKFVYGARVPWTDIQLPGLRDPKRGEVIVFQLARDGRGGLHPADSRPELGTDTFVKRLVGLPGDRVAVWNGRVMLNGETVPLEARGETFTDKLGNVMNVYVETLGNCQHRVLDNPAIPALDMEERVVPPGRYLLMGDNRDYSHDGRRFGSVRRQELEGPAGFLYWSWDWNGTWLSLLNPLTWIDNLASKTRWSRMGGLKECLVDG